VVAVITEFGRTARINGTQGTDHGTGTVAFLAGGALKGGRVVADWPGLKELHENRDLKPTTDLRAVLKGLLKDHLRIEDKALAGDIFPDSAAAKPMAGQERVLYPGLSEAEEVLHRRAHGIPLHKEVLQWFTECTSELGIAPLVAKS